MHFVELEMNCKVRSFWYVCFCELLLRTQSVLLLWLELFTKVYAFILVNKLFKSFSARPLWCISCSRDYLTYYNFTRWKMKGNSLAYCRQCSSKSYFIFKSPFNWDFVQISFYFLIHLTVSQFLLTEYKTKYIESNKVSIYREKPSPMTAYQFQWSYLSEDRGDTLENRVKQADQGRTASQGFPVHPVGNLILLDVHEKIIKQSQLNQQLENHFHLMWFIEFLMPCVIYYTKFASLTFSYCLNLRIN